MTRTPLTLAALASAAVPGLDPVTVASLATASAAPYDAAVVTDADNRKWVVRAPLSAAGAAELDAAAAIVTLLSRHLSFGLPTPVGFAASREGGRAAVHALLPGSGINLDELGPEDDLVGAIGRALAEIHNLEPGLLESAGLETYTADEYRQRHLSDLDRAAASGRVPAALLSRWERALENVAIWQFAPTPIHGGIDGRHLLVQVHEATPKLTGITGWRRAKVADPADDFAAIVRDGDADTATEIARAYAKARTSRPDRHLLTRAQLIGELGYVTNLFDALAAGYPDRVTQAVHWLEQLADDLGEEDLVH
ncbi:MAG: phosphotransferase [Dermatophilaceae bacterium]